jgi:hypothetical protein
VLLAVVGAILTFAVRVEMPGIDLTVVGVILMVAGGAMIAYARRTTERERIITRVEAPGDPHDRQHTVRNVIRESKRD